MKAIKRTLVILTLAFLILFLRGRIVRLASQIKSLETEKIKIQEEVDILRKKVMEIRKTENIEKLAKKKGIIK